MRALDLHSVTTVDSIMAALARNRVVFVGETHDRYGHHLNQLEIIRRLHQGKPDLAIGLEFFQWPFQPVVDRYIADEIDERTFLRETEYYKRWRFDYRLYRPILQFAREHAIPVVALNVPAELTRKVAEGGLASLSPEERATVPAEFDRSNGSYRERIQQVYEMHRGQQASANFENFFESQLLWDEGMAETAANWLRAHPKHSMVILAGSGHVMYGTGIPDRLKRRLHESSAIVLNGLEAAMEPGAGDYLLLSRDLELPRAGLMGMYLEDGDKGVTVAQVEEGSGAGEAGVKPGDRLLSIDGFPIRDYADVKIAMLDREPGSMVKVVVERKALLLGESTETLTVALH